MRHFVWQAGQHDRQDEKMTLMYIKRGRYVIATFGLAGRDNKTDKIQIEIDADKNEKGNIIVTLIQKNKG